MKIFKTLLFLTIVFPLKAQYIIEPILDSTIISSQVYEVKNLDTILISESFYEKSILKKLITYRRDTAFTNFYDTYYENSKNLKFGFSRHYLNSTPISTESSFSLYDENNNRYYFGQTDSNEIEILNSNEFHHFIYDSLNRIVKDYRVSLSDKHQQLPSLSRTTLLTSFKYNSRNDVSSDTTYSLYPFKRKSSHREFEYKYDDFDNILYKKERHFDYYYPNYSSLESKAQIAAEIVYEYNYNSKGKLTKETSFFIGTEPTFPKDFTQKDTTITFYNKKNQIIKKINSTVWIKSQRVYIYKYIYQ